MEEIITANGINLNVQIITEKHKNIIGVYVLYNLKNQKCYVGQSLNVYKRFRQHIAELKRNHHYNHYLQRSWDKYGKGVFKGYILEIFNTENDLNNRELYYIKLLESRVRFYGYNLKLDTYSREKENISKNTDKVYPTLRKPVVQLDLEGKFINRFDSIVIAWKLTNIPRIGISLCCRKLGRTSGNFMWLFEKDYNDENFNFDVWVETLPKVNRNNKYYRKKQKQNFKKNLSNKRKQVFQISKDGLIIKKWDYIEKTKEYGFSPSKVSECCNGKIKTHKGYIWIFINNN